MLLYPDAFFESLPADYDGLFHWEYINDVLRPRRGIQLADVDAMCEIGDNFMSFETSNNAHKETVGHARMIAALIRTGRFAHIDIVGKKIPTQWRLRSAYADRDWMHDVDCRAAIADKVAAWAAWADDPATRATRDYTALFQTWRWAIMPARQRFIVELARSFGIATALGDFAGTALGQAAIERFKSGSID